MALIPEDSQGLDTKENKMINFQIGNDVLNTTINTLFNDTKTITLNFSEEEKVLKNYSEMLEYRIKDWDLETVELDPSLYPYDFMKIYVTMCENNKDGFRDMIKNGIILNLGKNEEILNNLFQDTIKFKQFTEFVNRLSHESLLYFIAAYIAWNYDKLYEKYEINSDESSSDSD